MPPAARPFAPPKVPLPKDFRALPLDPSRPLDVEIGCGVGFHPIAYALAHPERQLVAIERTKEKFAKFAGRLRGHESLPNLIPIHGDAVAWITHAIKPVSVDRYFLLYPNPYPKSVHRNRRFHRMPFFAHLVSTMKWGGSFTCATNEESLALETKAALESDWGLRLEEFRLLEADSRPRSHFEKKYLLRGDRCWNLVFRRAPLRGGLSP